MPCAGPVWQGADFPTGAASAPRRLISAPLPGQVRPGARTGPCGERWRTVEDHAMLALLRLNYRFEKWKGGVLLLLCALYLIALWIKTPGSVQPFA